LFAEAAHTVFNFDFEMRNPTPQAYRALIQQVL
jgi:hypothetical protein